MPKNCIQCLKYGKCYEGLFDPTKAEVCGDFLHQTGDLQRKAAHKEGARRATAGEVHTTKERAGRRRQL